MAAITNLFDTLHTIYKYSYPVLESITDQKRFEDITEEEDDNNDNTLYPDRQKSDIISIESCMDSLKTSKCTTSTGCSASVVTEREYLNKVTSQGTSMADFNQYQEGKHIR